MEFLTSLSVSLALSRMIHWTSASPDVDFGSRFGSAELSD
jgi:hypothetical protein